MVIELVIVVVRMVKVKEMMVMMVGMEMVVRVVMVVVVVGMVRMMVTTVKVADGNGDSGGHGECLSGSFLSSLRCLPSSRVDRVPLLPPLPQDVCEVLILPGFYFRILTGYRQRSTCLSRHPATLSWSAYTPASRQQVGKIRGVSGILLLSSLNCGEAELA